MEAIKLELDKSISGLPLIVGHDHDTIDETYNRLWLVAIAGRQAALRLMGSNVTDSISYYYEKQFLGI